MSLRERQISIKGAKFFVSFQDWWPLIGVFLLLTSCMSHNGESMDKEIEHADEGFGVKTYAEKGMEYTDEGFSIKIPAGVEVEKKVVIDFLLYYFRIGEEHFLTAYVGNSPSYRSTYAQENTIEKTGLINNVPFKRVEFKGRSGQKRVEILFRFPSNRFWPKYMHFIYEDIPSNLESIAEKIMNSLKEEDLQSPIYDNRKS
jgi:hypothetical protein